jgi:REP element-mobilizing transposase RayT
LKPGDAYAIVGAGFKPAPRPHRPMTDRTIDGPRRKHLRLREYDYATPGAYFVTICTHERRFLFGRIVDQVMQLSALGRIVERNWFDLRHHYERIELENFVVMPNHLHGIVVLKPALIESDRIHALPEIVRGFKTFSSRAANKLRGRVEPLWQRGFHDRIVRDEGELRASATISTTTRWFGTSTARIPICRRQSCRRRRG